MAKKLIVLSDGTGNSAAKLFKTNVWKLYEALDLTPSSDQIAAYDDGVGTSRFKPWALLTGAFGFGLKRNVLKMYVFLSRHYHNEIEAQLRATGEGGAQQDPKALPIPPEIYGFGFSRGAFTVRVLAGLVIRQGLVPNASESEMARMALLSYRAYRKQCFHTKTGIEKPFRKIRDAIATLVDRLRHRPEYDPNLKTEYGKPNAGGVRMNTGGVRIRLLGLWDTVAAYGMPIEALRVAIDKLIFPLSFTSCDLPLDVDCARHALSIDDERSAFSPVLWNYEPGDRLKQVWFAGMHANVGGGYPDDSLSSLPLAWIAMEARRNGLCVRNDAMTTILGRATPYGKMYDSRSGFGSFYRYSPRDIRCDPSIGDIPVVHESVVFRMATGYQAYAPIALPKLLQVLDNEGRTYQFVDFKKTASEWQHRFKGSAAAPEPDHDHTLAAVVAELKAPESDEVELVRAGVLRRQFAHFGALLLMLVLLMFPFFESMVPSRYPSLLDEDWFFPSASEREPANFLLQQLIRLLNILLQLVGLRMFDFTPSYLLPWLKAFMQSPIVAFTLLVVAKFIHWRSSALRTVIADRCRAAWNIGHNSQQSVLRASRLDRLALELVDSARAKATWAFLVGKLFPAFVMLLVVLVPAILLDRTIFWLKSSIGRICPSETPHDLRSVTGQWQNILFRADEPCVATKFRVMQGRRYQLHLSLPAKGEWSDGGNEADLTGLNFSKLSWRQTLFMHAATPARRKLGEPWFVPIARVGSSGSEEYVLTASDVIGGAKPRHTMVSVIAPRKNGELFLFVNDAYSGLFPLAWLEPAARRKSGWSAPHLYGNNSGTGTVAIRREDKQDD